MSKYRYLNDRLNMEKAGSPVTCSEMDKKGGKTSFKLLLGKVVKVSNSINPRQRGWHGSLQQKCISTELNLFMNHKKIWASRKTWTLSK